MFNNFTQIYMFGHCYHRETQIVHELPKLNLTENTSTTTYKS